MSAPAPNGAGERVRLVSVAIISRDRHSVLEATVDAVRSYLRNAPTPWRVELLVIEEGDEPVPLPGTRYRFLPRRNRGFGYARNRAVENARGDIVVFVDDDVRPSARWLELLLAPFEDPEVVAVGGGVLPDPDYTGPVGACLAILGFPAGGIPRALAAWSAPRQAASLSTTNCAFRRSAWEAVGGFDESFRYGCEDADFFRRLRSRGRLMFYGAPFVFHRQRERAGEIFRWAVRRGRAYFCLDVVARSPLCAAIGPVRQSLPLKAAAWGAFAVAFGGIAGVSSGLALAGLGVCAWYAVVLARARRLWRPDDAASVPGHETLFAALRDMNPLPLVPAVKFLIDIGEACGRIAMVKTWCLHRFIQRPSVVFYADKISTSDKARNSLERDLAALREQGGRTVTLAEIVDRLQQRPGTLFTMPTLAPVILLRSPALMACARRLILAGERLTVLAPWPANSGDDSQEIESSVLAARIREFVAAGAAFGLFRQSSDAPEGDGICAIRRTVETAAELYGAQPEGIALPSDSKPRLPDDAIRRAGYRWVLRPGPGIVTPHASPLALTYRAAEKGTPP